MIFLSGEKSDERNQRLQPSSFHDRNVEVIEMFFPDALCGERGVFPPLAVVKYQMNGMGIRR